MDTTLFYFTGTGNSLQLSRWLAAELGDTELVPIAAAVHDAIEIDSERVGIIFPVYCFGMPHIVSRFIDGLPPMRERYVFAVCTHGGLPAGTLREVANRLERRDVKLSAGYAVRMPGNCMTLYDVWPEQKQRDVLASARERVRGIAAAVRAREEHAPEVSVWPVSVLFGLVRRAAFSHFARADTRFWVTDACNGCGLCAQVCPVANIAMRDGRPVWRHQCEQCLACLQWCPQRAIQSGKLTQRRGRYHHPEVKVEDLIRAPTTPGRPQSEADRRA